jgi:ATP-dependent RNA helicase DDX55/SPB4
MTVRKLPLTRQPYLDVGLEEVEAPESLDPAALDLMTEIRRLVKTDRELVDKVSSANMA